MKKPINVRQVQDYDCGPTAVINLMRWLDTGMAGLALRDLRSIVSIRLKTDEDGTAAEDMHAMIRETAKIAKAKVKLQYNITFDEIYNHLVAGGCLVLDHVDGDGEWHYSFWVMNNGIIRGVNSDSSSKKPEYSIERLKYYLKCSEGYFDHLPSGWFISKGKR